MSRMTVEQQQLALTTSCPVCCVAKRASCLSVNGKRVSPHKARFDKLHPTAPKPREGRAVTGRDFEVSVFEPEDGMDWTADVWFDSLVRPREDRMRAAARRAICRELGLPVDTRGLGTRLVPEREEIDWATGEVCQITFELVVKDRSALPRADDHERAA